MIGFLQGQVKFCNDDRIVVLAGGVGYNVYCCEDLINSTEEGDEIELYIEPKISETDFILFGLKDYEQQILFQELCKVQGLGGKTALTLLSHLGYEGICYAVIEEDFKTISTTKGIGPKIAKKVCVDLAKFVSNNFEGSSELLIDTGTSKIVKSALTSMGIPISEANLLVKEISKTENVSNMKAPELIAQALQNRI
jgi:Holliday junction DNA helicase RuvA